MAAPIGNKFALGNKGGRPREFDLEEEAKAFIEWADKEDSLVLRLFAAIRGYAAQSKINEYAERSEEFREAHNYAKIVIGARRERLLIQGKGHPAPFQRYAALYDPDLQAHEKELKKQGEESVQYTANPKRPY